MIFKDMLAVGIAIFLATSVESCIITVQSSGASGRPAFVSYGEDVLETFMPFMGPTGAGTNGIAVVEFDPEACNISRSETFDTSASIQRAADFRQRLDDIEIGQMVIIATAGGYVNSIGFQGTLNRLGSPVEGPFHDDQSSLAIITTKIGDHEWCPKVRAYASVGAGPTKIGICISEMDDSCLEIIEPCMVDVRSYGNSDATIRADGSRYLVYGFNELNYTNGIGRGITPVVLDPLTCTIEFETYDTYGDASGEAVRAFREHIKNIPVGSMVILVTYDAYGANLGGQEILAYMGSPTAEHAFRSSLALITRKVDVGGFCPLAKAYQDTGAGPAHVAMGTLDMEYAECLSRIDACVFNADATTFSYGTPSKSLEPFATDPQGIAVTVVDEMNCMVESSSVFDTMSDANESTDFANYIDGLDEESIMVIQTNDDYTANLAQSEEDLLVAMGSPAIPSHTADSSLALIALKDDEGGFCTFAADYQLSHGNTGHASATASSLVVDSCQE